MTRALVTTALASGLALFAIAEASAACRQVFDHVDCGFPNLGK